METEIKSVTDSPPARRRWWRKKRYAIPLIVVVPILIVVGLFVINGLVLANGERPVSNITSEEIAADVRLGDKKQLKVMAFNIAKGFVYESGVSFRSADRVRERMKRIGRLINDQQSDLVFLSEVVFQCHPAPVDQVRLLSRESGLEYWVFGENYNFGLPFYRIVGGNAILARFPIQPVDNPSLAGRRPFYITKNSRRALWCQLNLGNHKVMLTSVHNDAFNPTNNLLQARQLLDYCAGHEAIMAGDFNAQPDEPPIQLIRASERFVGALDGPLTFPADRPEQTIDFVFAPAGWTLIEHQVIQSDCSDHLPVVSTFRLP